MRCLVSAFDHRHCPDRAAGNSIKNLFLPYKGKPVDSLKAAYSAAKKRVGIKRRIQMYDFRHAFVTRILNAGGDLKSVSEIAGHSNVDTTMKIYQHTCKALHRETVAKLPDMEFPEQLSRN